MSKRSVIDIFCGIGGLTHGLMLEKAGYHVTYKILFCVGRFGHPDQDRALTLREAALLQTFPEDYQFIQPNTSYNLEDVGRFIGNAVPVELGRVIGRCIDIHLKSCS